jgi:phage shock protein PspC (stress-responsive transcriptional regulator)
MNIRQRLKVPSIINAKKFIGLQDFERVRQDRALAGICTSISEITGVRVLKIRILVITLMALDSSGGIFCFYLLFWLIIPLREKRLFARTKNADEVSTVS